MRMWLGVPPHTMCRQHLLGEHVELHMLASALDNKRSVVGYLRRGLLVASRLRARHAALVSEMLSRGYSHQSPFVLKDTGLMWSRGNVKELRERNLVELARRCDRCRGRQGM